MASFTPVPRELRNYKDKEAHQIDPSNIYAKYYNQQQNACEQHDKSLTKSGENFYNLLNPDVIQAHEDLSRQTPNPVMKAFFHGVAYTGKGIKTIKSGWSTFSNSFSGPTEEEQRRAEDQYQRSREEYKAKYGYYPPIPATTPSPATRGAPLSAVEKYKSHDSPPGNYLENHGFYSPTPGIRSTPSPRCY